MPHFVYMLRCKGNRIYTGYAADVQARYEQHCKGRGARFTKAFPPECVLRTFELNSKEEALRLEARIKKLNRSKKELLACGKDSPDETLSKKSAFIEAKLMENLGETLKNLQKKSRRKPSGRTL